MSLLEDRKREYEASFRAAAPEKVSGINLAQALAQIEIDTARDIIDSAGPELTGMTETEFIRVVNAGRGEFNGSRFRHRLSPLLEKGQEALAIYRKRFPIVEAVLNSKPNHEDTAELRARFEEAKRKQRIAEAA